MISDFINQIISLSPVLKIFLGIFIFALISIISIITTLFIKNKKKKLTVLNEVELENLLIEIRSLISLRSKSKISFEDFKNKKNIMLCKIGFIDILLKKINNFDYLQKYLAAIDKLDDCILIVFKNEIKYANEKFYKVLGYTKKDINSKTIFEIIYPEDFSVFNQYNASTANGDYDISSNILRLLTKDSKMKWFEYYTTEISENDYHIIFLKDISKIAEAENEALDFSNKYLTLFDYSPDPIIELDISNLNLEIKELNNLGIKNIKLFIEKNHKILLGLINNLKIVNANRAVYDYFNLKEKAYNLNNLFQFLREELKDLFLEIISGIVSGKLNYESEFTFLYSPKIEKHIIVKFSIIQNNGTETSRALLSFSDITEQKNLIKKTENLSLFQESVIYNANIWLSVYDKDLKILIWNKAAEIISGYKKAEVLNNDSIWVKLYPDEAIREEVIKKIKGISSTGNGDSEEFETKIKCKDKKEKIILLSVKKINSDEGSNINVIIIGYDYTEKKKMEDKLKYVANHDALTKLYNRAFFEDQLELMFKERDSKVGIIVLDIDGLKYVNDTLGHQEGDKIIINTAKFLNRTFRPSDIISRIGGDEFAVLIRNINKDGIKIILRRLEQRIDEHNESKKTSNYPLNISFGYALRDNGKNAVEIFKKADDMLFSKKLQRKDAVIDSALSAIQATMFEKDSITEEHMQRLKNIAYRFGNLVGLDEYEKKMLVLSTELHDIGKVIISDEILNKQSNLSKEEYEVIKKHSESGYRIAKLTPTIKHVSEFILYSHERWDGNGYPKGLKGEEIPLISRMLHIIDAYDVMINHRPYKDAITEEEAIEELKRCSESQFDPTLVKKFVNNVLPQIKKELEYTLVPQ